MFAKRPTVFSRYLLGQPTGPTSFRLKSAFGVTHHYLESLDYQRQIVKVHTILGVKEPTPELFWRRGTVPNYMNDTGAQEGTMVNQIWVNLHPRYRQDTIKFIEEVYSGPYGNGPSSPTKTGSRYWRRPPNQNWSATATSQDMQRSLKRALLMPQRRHRRQT